MVCHESDSFFFFTFFIRIVPLFFVLSSLFIPHSHFIFFYLHTHTHTQIPSGTAYVLDGEEEPSKGRILVFSVKTDLRGDEEEEEEEEKKEEDVDDESLNQLVKILDITCAGAPYTVQSFQGHLIAGINSYVMMYEWRLSEEGNILQKLCRCEGHFISLLIRTRGDYIAVGDLMKSVRVLKFNSETQTLMEIARDSNCNWMSALACLDADTFLGAEDSSNLFTVALNREAKTEEEKARLMIVGEYHLGDNVNQFCEGSLVMRAVGSKDKDGAKEDEENEARAKLMFGTVSGMIGVIISISKHDFLILQRLQKAMTKVIKGVGGLSHSDWRSFSNEYRRTPKQSSGFIDGDMVELMLDPDVNAKTREEILKLLNGEEGEEEVSEKELFALVTKLSRMH